MHFVFDLDGTLCFDGMTIANDIKNALQKAKHFGHQVSFASARFYRDCIAVLGDKLSRNRVVGLNGGLVYDKSEIVFHRRLDKASYQRILD